MARPIADPRASGPGHAANSAVRQGRRSLDSYAGMGARRLLVDGVRCRDVEVDPHRATVNGPRGPFGVGDLIQRVEQVVFVARADERSAEPRPAYEVERHA